MSPLTEYASSFAARAHEGQTRKYTGEPYINHPEAVAKIVEDHGGDEEMIAAAWLHDVVEDTSWTLSDIREAFGDDVATLVDALTEKTTLVDGNRAKRKAMECERLSMVSDRAKTIKVADLLDNLISIVPHDPGFARVFFREASSLIQALQGADRDLMAKLENLLGDISINSQGLAELNRLK